MVTGNLVYKTVRFQLIRNQLLKQLHIVINFHYIFNVVG